MLYLNIISEKISKNNLIYHFNHFFILSNSLDSLCLFHQHLQNKLQFFFYLIWNVHHKELILLLRWWLVQPYATQCFGILIMNDSYSFASLHCQQEMTVMYIGILWSHTYTLFFLSYISCPQVRWQVKQGGWGLFIEVMSVNMQIHTFTL